jgi:hypothetical protein
LGKEYRSLSSSLCNFLHSPVTSSLLGPNTLLNTLSHGTAKNFIRFPYLISINYSIIPTKTLSVTVSLSLFMETEKEDNLYLYIFQDVFEGKVFDFFRISSLFYVS